MRYLIYRTGAYKIYSYFCAQSTKHSKTTDQIRLLLQSDRISVLVLRFLVSNVAELYPLEPEALDLIFNSYCGLEN
jgi:hypothetical protein